jgi:hypothetical protein
VKRDLVPVPKLVQEQPRTFSPGHDAKTKKVLDDFYGGIGGREAIKSIVRYRLSGSTRVEVSGIQVDYDVTAYRDSNGRFAEHLESEILGDMRQITTGKSLLLQNDLGMEVDIPVAGGANDVDPFFILIELAKGEEAFPSLSYTGEYVRNDRNTAVVEGRLASGETVRFAFDIATKMLVNYTGPRSTVTFGDYRKVGNLTLPFALQRGPIATQAEEIVINPVIDGSVFEKKKLCFDTAIGQ